MQGLGTPRYRLCSGPARGILNNMDIQTNPLRDLEQTTRDLNTRMHKHSRTVFGQYPLLFSLLATFGAVSILYGFDALLDEIPAMRAYPVIPLALGILILTVTGTLYKRLEKKIDEIF